MKFQGARKLGVAALLATISCGALASPILWIGDSDGTLGTVDVATGATTVVGQMSTTMTDIAFDPLGNLWGISFNQLFRIDSATAATTLVGNTGLATANSLVFGADGTLYTATTGLYTLNTTTGAATSLGGSGGYSSSGDLAFIGSNLYLSSVPPGSDSLFRVNALNGAGTLIGSIGYAGVYGFATDNNVDLYGLSNNNVLRINTSTGAGSVIQSYSFGALGTAWGTAFRTEAGATSVPEPTTLSLLGLGLLGVGLLRRKRLI